MQSDGLYLILDFMTSFLAPRELSKLFGVEYLRVDNRVRPQASCSEIMISIRNIQETKNICSTNPLFYCSYVAWTETTLL